MYVCRTIPQISPTFGKIPREFPEKFGSCSSSQNFGSLGWKFQWILWTFQWFEYSKFIDPSVCNKRSSVLNIPVVKYWKYYWIFNLLKFYAQCFPLKFSTYLFSFLLIKLNFMVQLILRKIYKIHIVIELNVAVQFSPNRSCDVFMYGLWPKLEISVSVNFSEMILAFSRKEGILYEQSWWWVGWCIWKNVMMTYMMCLPPYIDTISTCKHVSMLMHTLFHMHQFNIIIIYSSFPMYPIWTSPHSVTQVIN